MGAVTRPRDALQPTRRPTLRVRGAEVRAQRGRQPEGPPPPPDGSATRIGFIFGAGLVARFFEVYEREGANGERGAAKIVARIFGGSFVGGRTAKHVLTPQACAIVVDGEPAPFDRVSLVAASVIEDLGLHMRLLHRAAESTERFHFVATPAPPRALAPQMFRVLSGIPLREPKVDRLAGRVTMRFPVGTGAYVLDGELLRSDVVEVEAGPVLRFVDVD
jgi:diacylglycerol kinase family enzyme